MSLTGLEKKWIFAIYSVLILFMILGTLFDLQISSFLYHPNKPLSVFISHYGAYAGIPITFSALAIYLRILMLNQRDGSVYLGTLLSIFMAYQSIRSFVETYDTPGIPLLHGIPAIGIAAALAIYIFLKLDISDPVLAKRAGHVLLLSFSLQLILINKVIKTPWGRPRFRSILTIDGMDYRPWHRIGLTNSARELISQGVNAEEFKSFPSGHAGISGSLFSMTVLTRLIPAWRGRENLFTSISCIWSLCVILGRIMAGAHFPSDVSMGIVISFTFYLIFSLLFIRKN